MKLAEVLAETTTEELERVAHEHARSDEKLSRHQLLETIEGVLRSYRFVQEFLFDRQPPTFSIVTLLLDASDFAQPTTGFREAVLAETQRICQAIDAGEILRRDDQLRVYRRVLYQARSNDQQVDSSEAAILGVLRQELEVSQVEHFLIEHHADLREFWHQDVAFDRQLHALRSTGIVFVRESWTLIPEDLAPIVRQVLGIDMSRDAVRRLFACLGSQDLYEALAAVGAPTSGSKDERIERLIAHMAQPRRILRRVGMDTLKRICRETGAPVSGSKEDLVDRVVSWFATGRDLAPQTEIAEPAPVEEPRTLDEIRFALLFERLRGQQLADILGEFDLRRWGTKEFQIRTLWDAHRSESTLLSRLSNQELETLLRRVSLKGGGSKSERIARLLDRFSKASHDELRAQAGEGPTEEVPQEPPGTPR